MTLESRSGRVLLDDVSVEIPAGARTAILGLQEDSKLALACLIPRLIDPKSAASGSTATTSARRPWSRSAPRSPRSSRPTSSSPTRCW